MTADDPFIPPDMTHVVIDTDLQMQRYLADIAMEDMLLSPPASARKERPGGLMAQYRKIAAHQHELEKESAVTEVVEVVEITADQKQSIPDPRGSVPAVPPPVAYGPENVREVVKKD